MLRNPAETNANVTELIPAKEIIEINSKKLATLGEATEKMKEAIATQLYPFFNKSVYVAAESSYTPFCWVKFRGVFDWDKVMIYDTVLLGAFRLIASDIVAAGYSITDAELVRIVEPSELRELEILGPGKFPRPVISLGSYQEYSPLKNGPTDRVEMEIRFEVSWEELPF